jgi:hypothetical protein
VLGSGGGKAIASGVCYDPREKKLNTILLPSIGCNLEGERAESYQASPSRPSENRAEIKTGCIQLGVKMKVM